MMSNTASEIPPHVSQNFHVAKFLSIMAVFGGHYFDEIEILWVPVTIALLIFSWSSGFFTYLKYNGDFDKKIFWKKKINRLAVNLTVINLFLLILFLIQGRTGIWSWHTLVNILGMNGFLNWFRIPDYSPFGAGMWFFTLLIIFYLLYPGLEFINRKKSMSYIFSILFVAAAFCLNRHVTYGHALWLTACGFIAGIFCARNDIRFPKYASEILLLLVFCMTFYMNFILKIKTINFFFIFMLAIFTIFSFKERHIPAFLFTTASFFSGCLLEIYLIHSYLIIRPGEPRLFITPTGCRAADFLLSVVLVLGIAKMLQYLSSIILKKLNFGKI